MRKMILVHLSFFLLLAPCLGFADGTIRFKSGEMGLDEYVEMAAGAIPLPITNASEDLTKYRLRVPRLEAMDREHALAQMLATLLTRGFTLVEDEQFHFQRLMRVKDARDTAIPFITDLSAAVDNDKLVTFAFPLKHTSVEVVARTLRSFAPPSARLIPVESSRTLLITDASRSVAKYRDLIARLDTPEAAKDAERFLKEQRKRNEDEECPAGAHEAGRWGGPRITVLIMLLGLIGMLVGFITRGYVIRRIEGGL